MMYFPSIGAKVSILFIIPIGFATGILAATLAVGGFIGVPAMIYILGASGLMASATQLAIAFVISLFGTIIYALDGFVDIRLAMILIAGSLFGVQLGSIATTYAKNNIIKVVTVVLMTLILFSLVIKIPVYLSEMGHIEPLTENTVAIFDYASFAILVLALVAGAIIILYAFISGSLKYAKEQDIAEKEPTRQKHFPTSATQLLPTGRFEKIIAVTDGSEFSSGATGEAIRLAQRTEGSLLVMSVVMTNPEHEYLARELIDKENNDAMAHLA